MLVTVEGIDGSGKGTVIKSIREVYPQAVLTKEPTDSQFGQMVRERLSKKDSDSILDFYLFMADRVNHINTTIKPNDVDGGLVVSDRYADSTRAYQPVALHESGVFDTQWEAKSFVESTMGVWNYEPDLTIYIDVSVETAMERASGDEKYEQRQFLNRVRDNYEGLFKSDEFGSRMVRIDGEQAPEDVATAAIGKLNTASPDRI